jgi:hypothetical protein
VRQTNGISDPIRTLSAGIALPTARGEAPEVALRAIENRLVTEAIDNRL